MSLGERIYEFRRKKNLSQGDLAEMLDVSRQSVSKWENNSAVPDLDKIVKLGEIFEVSLDELVNGEACNAAEIDAGFHAVTDLHEKENADTAVTTRTHSPRVTAGLILIGMAVIICVLLLAIGGGREALTFAFPFLLCGIICLIFKKNTVLWCMWGLFFCVESYLKDNTVASRGNALLPIIGIKISEIGLKPIYIVAGWILWILLAVLIGFTVFLLSKKPFADGRKASRTITVSWIVCAAAIVLGIVIPRTKLFLLLFSTKIIIGDVAISRYIMFRILFLFDYAKISAFTVALVNSVRAFRGRKNKN